MILQKALEYKYPFYIFESVSEDVVECLIYHDFMEQHASERPRIAALIQPRAAGRVQRHINNEG